MQFEIGDTSRFGGCTRDGSSRWVAGSMRRASRRRAGERAPHGDGLLADRLDERACRRVGHAAALLPVAQRRQRDVIALGKLLLRQLEFRADRTGIDLGRDMQAIGRGIGFAATMARASSAAAISRFPSLLMTFSSTAAPVVSGRLRDRLRHNATAAPATHSVRPSASPRDRLCR